MVWNKKIHLTIRFSSSAFIIFLFADLIFSVTLHLSFAKHFLIRRHHFYRGYYRLFVTFVSTRNYLSKHLRFYANINPFHTIYFILHRTPIRRSVLIVVCASQFQTRYSYFIIISYLKFIPKYLHFYCIHILLPHSSQHLSLLHFFHSLSP